MQESRTSETPAGQEKKHRSLTADTFYRFRRSKMAMVGAFIVAFLIFVAVFAPFLTHYDPRQSNAWNSLRVPSGRHMIPTKEDLKGVMAPVLKGRDAWCAGMWDRQMRSIGRHLMGTDGTGRDVFSRTLHGARISLLVGVGGILFALIIGLTLGSLSGYYGGWIDAVIMRFTDIVLAFPAALLAIAVAAVFQHRSIFTLFLILGIIRWASIARIVRSRVISIRDSEFSEAARALGGSDFRIIFRHILPNSFAPIMIAATIGIAGNILTEAWLSFLGLGLDVSVPSWGTMIQDGRTHLQSSWTYIFPGIAIMISVLGFNLLGDGLRDVLDPRLKGAGQ